MSLIAPKVLFPGNAPTLIIPNSTLNYFYQGRYKNDRNYYQNRFNPYSWVETPANVSKVRMTAIYPDPLQFVGEGSIENCIVPEVGGSTLKHSEIDLCRLYHYSTACPLKYNSCLNFTVNENGQASLTNPSGIAQEVENLAAWLGEAPWGHHVMGQFFGAEELAAIQTALTNKYGVKGDGTPKVNFIASHNACPGYMSQLDQCDIINEDELKDLKECNNDEDRLKIIEGIYHRALCCAEKRSPKLSDAIASGIPAPGSGEDKSFQFIVSSALWNITLKLARTVSRRAAQNPNCPEACSTLEFVSTGNPNTPDIFYNGHPIIPERGFCYWDSMIGKKTYAIVATVQGVIGMAGRTNPIAPERIPTIAANSGREILRDGVGLVYQKKPGLNNLAWEMFYGLEVGTGVADTNLAVADIAFV